ncbi:CaiB/BaiF CoA transferase family protein [Achromobacter denitrificans]
MIREALKGITVLDFTQIGAGPTCAMLLGDMGARVTKVEPLSGEIGRGLGPAWVGDDAALFHGFNRGKRGIALDIKTEGGREIARKLIAAADVVIESMRPGAMSRAGLGYEALREEHPRLVYCSISAYGQEGPYADRAGVDGVLQADSGLMSLIGAPGGEPCKVQAPVVDIMTGYVSCMGVLAALAQRDRTGLGQHIDASLMGGALALQQSSISCFFADGRLPQTMGSAAPYAAPNQAYRAADGWIMVAAYTSERWTALCGVLQRPELEFDPRFETSPLRVQNLSALTAELNRTFRTRTCSEWLAALGRVDVLCTKVASYEDLPGHPQIDANRMLVELDIPGHGKLRMPGFPLNPRQANSAGYTRAPAVGEHTRTILSEAGYSNGEIDRLEENGAVRCARHE